MDFDSMSPTKRILMKEKINQSNEGTLYKYSAAVEAKYPIFRIHYQISKDYLDIPDVDKRHNQFYPITAFTGVASKIYFIIEKNKPNVKESDIEQLYYDSKELFKNDLEKCFKYLDKFTAEFYKYQHLSYKDSFFEIPIAHMRTVFPNINEQMMLLFDQSTEKEIKGDVFSMLLILYWRIIKNTFFPFKSNYLEILPNIILMEYLVQLNSAISLKHDFDFKIQKTMGFNSPIIKVFRKMVYVEIKMKEGDYILDRFEYFNKLKGVGTGYIYEIRRFRIYCKELFVQSNFYNEIKREQVISYLESLKIRRENHSDKVHSFSTNLNPYNDSFHVRRDYDLIYPTKSKTNISSVIFTSENCYLQEDRVNIILHKFINPYAESLSYFLLYYLGFTPSLNIVKSILSNKIYLMVDQVPSFDKEFGSEYCIGKYFYVDPQEFTSKRLNNLCVCFHTFLLFNYLFHLGDFHDGNYSICTKDDKFKIQIFDLWMSPFQIQLNDIIRFSGIPEYDENHHCNSSLSYYLLYFDISKKVEENTMFNISKLMTTLTGRSRLPFITIKSLKMIFSLAMKNLDKIFESKEKFYSKIVVKTRCHNDKMQLSSNILIEKIYDSSRELLLKNPFLIDDFIDYISVDDYRKYYPTDDEDINFFNNRPEKVNSHEYLVKFSTQRLMNLFKKLLMIPRMDMVFIKKPFSYHVYGNIERMTPHSNYRKSFAQSEFSLFIRSPHNIDWIFVFFAIDCNISSFFEDFQETEIKMERIYLFKNESCFFVVFNDIVLCDLYRIHLSNLLFIEDSVSDDYRNSLLFSYRRL